MGYGVRERILEMKDWLVEIRGTIHMHPELMYEEEKTAELVAHNLEKLGLAGEKRSGQDRRGGRITAWIMGALVAAPIFLVAIFSPITFLSGFVRLFRSNLWTLTYRELPSLKQVETAVAAQTGAPLSRPAVP